MKAQLHSETISFLYIVQIVMCINCVSATIPVRNLNVSNSYQILITQLTFEFHVTVEPKLNSIGLGLNVRQIIKNTILLTKGVKTSA